ncbi:MAG: CPBP family intramembrane metalloprotease [Deltaproteobacteria bacterium]|nr:CPBP family intramembrane metalloprotease [Deltaproteobacteria bacterium]
MIKENSKKDFLQVMIFWLFVCLAIHLWVRLSFLPFFKNLSPLVTVSLLLYLPGLVFKGVPDFYSFFEKDKKTILYSLKILLVFSLIVFPVFFAANHFFQAFFFRAHYHPTPFFGLAEGRLYLIFLNHLLLVALPEEYFFRAFLWDKLQCCFTPSSTPISFLGVPLTGLFFFNAFLFAFSHSLIVLQWWHFAIFFPGLAFVWLRLKTHGLLAPVLFHALCNVANYWISMHYR